MEKSPDAFRTISEVADWLGTPTHVLRFWESRFTQVKPVKRAGGRRYYRPGDMELLGGIKKLLHDDGMTIRGVQKLLREEGIKHVAALSPPLGTGAEAEDADLVEATALPEPKSKPTSEPKPEAAPAPMITDAPQDDADNVVPLSRTLAETPKPTPADAPEPATAKAEPEPEQADAPKEDDAQLDLLRYAEPEVESEPEPEPEDDRPSFLRHDRASRAGDPAPAVPDEAEPEPTAADQPRPADVNVPDDPADDDTSFPAITDVAAMLRKAAAAPSDNRPSPSDMQGIYDRLVGLRERMGADKRN